MAEIKEELPKGVELFELGDFPKMRKAIFEGMKDEISSAYPHSYNGLTIALDEVDYEDPEEYDLKTQKDALLNNKFLTRRLRGTYRVFDDNTGDMLDEKRVTLMRVPYMTERGTFVYNGNEYGVKAQSRMIPGAYTRRQANGELETQFNTRPGSTNFRIGVNPEDMQYRMRIQQANLHLYSLLHDLGVPDKELEERWGKSIFQQNKNKYDSRVFDKAFERLVPARVRRDIKGDDLETKRRAIQEALDNTQINERVARTNLPNMFNRKVAAAWNEGKSYDGDLTEEESRSVIDHMTTPDEPTIKAARYGAGVLLKQPNGQYLLEENYDDGEIAPSLVGKLRPVGGGASVRDKTLRHTIIREIKEELGLEPEFVDSRLKLLGYMTRGKYKDCAVFEMEDHGLSPGTYSASNAKDEFVTLVERSLQDENYIGWQKESLRKPHEEDVNQYRIYGEYPAWIGVDLDGTLAKELPEFDISKIGDPVPPMIKKVKQWIGDGWTVKIFTARATHFGATGVIQRWLKQHGLPKLAVTNTKDPGMIVLYDDRSVRVMKNRGITKGATFSKLQEAKALSDQNRYNEKREILKQLLLEKPDEFVVDSTEGPYWGLKHTPTNFRIHVDRSVVPANIKR